MRILLSLLAILTVPGCADNAVRTTLCTMGPEFRTWEGTRVRLEAMLTNGSEESPPMIVDMDCWRSIAADFSEVPEGIKLLERPGRFNKFAQVTGRLQRADSGQMWLHVTSLTSVREEPPKSEAAESMFFRRMVRERNSYFHPRAD